MVSIHGSDWLATQELVAVIAPCATLRHKSNCDNADAALHSHAHRPALPTSPLGCIVVHVAPDEPLEAD